MKKYMPLNGLRWSRDSGSALCGVPPNSRSRTGWGGISFLGKNSLIIMCIHEPIKRVLLVILSKVTSLPIDNLRGNILLSIICVLVLLLVCVPIINIINKKLAWMIGKF